MTLAEYQEILVSQVEPSDYDGLTLGQLVREWLRLKILDRIANDPTSN